MRHSKQLWIALVLCQLVITATTYGQTPAPSPAATIVFVPIADNRRFNTLPPGTLLPSGEECRNRINRSTEERRSRNEPYNQYVAVQGTRYDAATYSAVGGDYVLQPWGGGDPRMNTEIQARIDGNFTGTTDEILQWGACKWGFNEDTVRAVAVDESWWRMYVVGDNNESFGIMQVRRTHHHGTYPASAKSTAFNVDYALAWRRACYEGYTRWLAATNPAYTAGDEWGCIGIWYSGRWYDSGAQWYINKVRNHFYNRTWTLDWFGSTLVTAADQVEIGPIND